MSAAIVAGEAQAQRLREPVAAAGPTTIAMLLRNTPVAAHGRAGLNAPEGL